MRFELTTANRIVFGEGALKEVAPEAGRLGQRALLVTGSSPARAAALLDALKSAGLECARFAVAGEPTVGQVRSGAALARSQSCDLVISMGGGSAIDAGKAIAALLANSGDVMEYLEVIGNAKPLAADPAPFIAVPTTAGTGSEVTRNSVLASPEHRLKVSMRSPRMLPRLALVDPTLTQELPPGITASSGFDALTQLIEPFVSARANPVTDGFCVDGLKRISRSLRRAYHDARDQTARADMSLAALLGGLALTNAGLGLIHGFASPLGGMYDAPHGALCAALLPFGMDANIRALRARAPAGPALARYATVAEILTGNAGAQPEEGVDWVRRVCEEMAIPPLASYSLRKKDFPVLVERASRANSMKTNPVSLTVEELHEVLERACE
ncbi:MAG: iron-containing alcohol dehydrogenase [Terriglobia bacterium]